MFASFNLHFFRVSVFVFLSFELTNFLYSSAIHPKLSVSVCMCERRDGILLLPIPRYSLFIWWLGKSARHISVAEQFGWDLHDFGVELDTEFPIMVSIVEDDNSGCKPKRKRVP